jgi:4,5-dihydroxyphthalate decarboxylase
MSGGSGAGDRPASQMRREPISVDAAGRLRLTIAVNDYDQIRDVTSGRVPVEGIALTSLSLEIEEIFYRFVKFREWDISELSFAKYAAMTAQGENVTAIPVFPSRMFRHSAFYVRPDGPVKTPADLAGKRMGIPEWAQTAGVYCRGLLAHEYGVDLASIEWVQAGVNEAGRVEKVALQLPPGIRYRAEPQRSLTEMLLDGSIDAIMSARPPSAFTAGDPRIVRLIQDTRGAEAEYFRKTGIYPIMHVLALRSEIVEAHPWVAMNLYKAFEIAKDRSLERARDVTASRFPLPWSQDHLAEIETLFGRDCFPYGIETNRPTLEAFLGYAHEQGLTDRQLRPEELFPKQVQSAFKV